MTFTDNPRRRLLFLLAPLLSLGACAYQLPRDHSAPTTQQAADRQPDVDISYTVERERRDFDLEKGVTRIRVRNPHGDLQVRRTGADTLGMLAIVQLLGENPETPEFVAHTEGDTLHLAVRYPSDTTLGEDARPHGHLKGRADVGLYVPARAQVELETTFGQIYVRRIPNDVEALTREGKILIGAGGSIRARSISGDVGAYPYAPDWSGTVDLESGSGTVTLQVPVALGVDVEARGRSLTTDFHGEEGMDADGSHFFVRRDPGALGVYRALSRLGDVHLRETIPVKH